MFNRAKYKTQQETDWREIKDPVAFLKRDGGNFFLQVEPDGSFRFFSRRQSVKGGFPERTAQLPHLTDVKVPAMAGHVFNVELVHMGTDKRAVENNAKASGILVSHPETAIQTQKETGPIRAVIHNVINPVLPTYADKLEHMKALETAVGKPDLLWVDTPHVGHKAINELITSTKKEGREGVVVLSHSLPEATNPRVKIVHRDHYNLRVVEVEPEFDKHGVNKGTMGALILADNTGAIVGKVGTGFDRADRQRTDWLGRVIQVSARGYTGKALKGPPVYLGDADGDVDRVVP